MKFEIIGIDNKLSPQETTSALRSAIDQGARYVTQGNGSGPALAIIDALEKHNARNPGKRCFSQPRCQMKSAASAAACNESPSP